MKRTIGWLVCLLVCITCICAAHPANATVRDVTAYGAVGNGVADDSNAIQNAINQAAGGDEIYFPGREYLITKTLTVQNKAGINLVAAGLLFQAVQTGWAYGECGLFYSTTGAANSAMLTIKNCTSYIKINHLGMDGGDRALYGLNLTNNTNTPVTITDCFIRACQWGLYVQPTQTGAVTAYKSCFTDCGSPTTVAGADIYLATAAACTFDTCSIAGRYTYGKDLVYQTAGSPTFRNMNMAGYQATTKVIDIVPGATATCGLTVIGGHYEISPYAACYFLYCNNTAAGRTSAFVLNGPEVSGEIYLNINSATSIHLEQCQCWGIYVGQQNVGQHFCNNVTCVPGGSVIYTIPSTMTTSATGPDSVYAQ